jgi:ubiquinone/menaquinone biosynthesis C-methylase UbiE
MNCDFIARWYRWLEYCGFGGALERRRFAFLPDVADSTRDVLVLGEGDGRFLAKFVAPRKPPSNHRETTVRSPCLSVDYVDLSAAMLDLARRRAGTDCVTYHHSDALTISLPAAHYDLVVTHFFLDCLSEDQAKSLVEKITRSARPNARWLISEFREPAAWAYGIVQILYLFFRITTGLRTRRLIDHHPLLNRAGFVLVKEETERFGLLASELWRFGDNRSR